MIKHAHWSGCLRRKVAVAANRNPRTENSKGFPASELSGNGKITNNKLEYWSEWHIPDTLVGVVTL